MQRALVIQAILSNSIKTEITNRMVIFMAQNAKIKITEDGPYIVTGGIPLLRMIIENDTHGDPCIWREVEKYPQRESYALCRCGRSRARGGSTPIPMTPKTLMTYTSCVLS
jgi:hypothetical protein